MAFASGLVALHAKALWNSCVFSFRPCVGDGRILSQKEPESLKAYVKRWPPDPTTPTHPSSFIKWDLGLVEIANISYPKRL